MPVRLSRRDVIGALSLGSMLGASASVHAATPPRYRIDDLGDLGGPSVRPFALNAQGVVTGVATRLQPDRNGAAFMGTPGALVPMEWRGDNSEGRGINDHGIVAGTDNIHVRGAHGAWVWDGLEKRYLRVRGGPELRSALDINNRGQIVGTANPRYLYVYHQGDVDLCEMPPDAVTVGSVSINAGGMVCGYGAYGLVSQGDRGFVIVDGRLEMLALPDCWSDAATGLNDAGHICGALQRWNKGPRHAYLLRDGELIVLGRLGGQGGSSVASAVNNLGMVVGSSEWSQNGSTVRDLAFLWLDGQMHELNTLADAKSQGWTLQTAVDINDAGQIVGRGRRDGVRRAYLATPL
jgi:probable HAF family extracellular repeat protein